MTYVEQDCIVHHNGRDFHADGAVVTESFAIAYLKFEGPERPYATGIATDWRGHRIGTARIVAKWATERSFYASHMLQVECCINGVKYTGRGAGNGMIWKGKRCAHQ
jgi:hypothetical protein